MLHAAQIKHGALAAAVALFLTAGTVLAQPVHNLTQGTFHDTLQQAIDAAVSGDEIEAQAGTYVENIDFLGKGVILRSVDPLNPDVVAATIIDGSALDTVVRIDAGSIIGFTITNGNGVGPTAGGVEAQGDAVVSSNVITGNVTDQRGGGVSATENAVIHHNRITNNTAGNRSGGVSARDDALIIDNIITGNHAQSGGGGVRGQERAVIRHNTITGNSSDDTGSGVIGGGGVLAEDESTIMNNIIAFSTDGVGIHVEPGGTVTANFNCVFGNLDGEYSGDAVPGAGDLNVDPLLEADGVHLQLSSTCIDAGDPSFSADSTETDIDNGPRVYVTRVDIGADEALDCNDNDISDLEDIINGTSDDCDRNGVPDECVSFAGGVVFLTGDDADDAGHCHGTACGSLFPNVFNYCIENSQSPGTGILAIGVNGGNAIVGLNSWNNPANGGPGVPLTILTSEEEIESVNFVDFAMIYIPSVDNHTSGGITDSQLAALNTRQSSMVQFVNNFGGALLALTEANVSIGYGWLPIPIETADQEHIDVCPTPALTEELSPNSTCDNMSHCCYHTIFTGPPGFLGLEVLAVSIDQPAEQVLMIGGADISLSAQARLLPSDAVGIIGESHTVTLLLTDAENPCVPVPDVLVTFEVFSGPNEGVGGTEITDSLGAASFTYFGGEDQGTDQIQASLIDPENGAQVLSNIVTMRWATDCNLNGIPDSTDIEEGTSTDCTHNGTPDECEPDCNANGAADSCDLQSGVSLDCNDNRVPDECDIAGGVSADCTANGVPDECDIADGTVLDCNRTGVPDECDVADGTSPDVDGDGVPDECENNPCCETPALCDGDVNGDGLVDPLDAGAVLARFGLDPGDLGLCEYDVNCDDEIDPLDSGYVLARLATCDPVRQCPSGCQPSVCPGTSDCCDPAETAGCDDEICCSAVCAADPYCCNVIWDELCVDEARDLCDLCGGGEGEGEGEGAPIDGE